MSPYKWDFIQDLPDNWQDFSVRELESLAEIWKQQAEVLRDKSPELTQFHARLHREWAIETGIVAKTVVVRVLSCSYSGLHRVLQKA